MALFTRVQHLCIFIIVAPLIYHLLLNVWKASYTISASIIVDVPYDCPMPRVSSSLLLYWVLGVVLPLYRRDRKRMDSEENDATWWYRTASFFITMQGITQLLLTITDLLRRCQYEILEHPPCSSDLSPCDYNLFAKVKEPLRGFRYSTRDDLVPAIGRSFGTSTKMDALMVHEAFQIFGKK